MRAADGQLELGRSLRGRGAWLCAGEPGCFERAVMRGAFERAFHQPVPVEAIARLRRQLLVDDGAGGETDKSREGSGPVMCEDGGSRCPHGSRTRKGH